MKINYSEALEKISNVIMEKTLISMEFLRIIKMTYEKSETAFYVELQDFKNYKIDKANFFGVYNKFLLDNELLTRIKNITILKDKRQRIKYLYSVTDKLQYFFDNYGGILIDLYHFGNIQKARKEFNDKQLRRMKQYG